MNDLIYCDPLHSLFGRFEPLVSTKFGIFSDVTMVPVMAGGPAVFLASANSRTRPGAQLESMGGGVGLTRERAFVRALGEGVERYAAKMHGQNAIVSQQSYRKLLAKGLNALDPRVFNHFTAEQYASDQFKIPFFDHDSRLDWVEGFYLDDRSSVWIPAAQVYYGYPDCAESTTNGLSCADSLDHAILSGLLELIERDALTAVWWSQAAWLEIDWRESRDSRLRPLAQKIGPWTDQVRLLTPAHLDHAIRPVFSVYERRPTQDDVEFVLAGGCALEPIVAIEKAVLENAHCYLACRSKWTSVRRRRFDRDWDRSILNFRDSLDLYASHGLPDATRSMTHPVGLVEPARLSERGPASDPANVEYVLDQMRTINCRPIAVDLTTRDIASCDLKVCRVLAPELVPLNGAHRYRPLAHRRIRELWSKFSDDPVDLNRAPHPFP